MEEVPLETVVPERLRTLQRTEADGEKGSDPGKGKTQTGEVLAMLGKE